MDLLSKQAYDDSWQALELHLKLIEQRDGLAAALRALHEHQSETGFIRDQLQDLRRFHLPSPDGSERFFSVQFNPARGRRHQGAGGLQAATPSTVNDGCFLCADNIWWQQRGSESGYHLSGLGARYTVWMNPFPLEPGHAVIASRTHLPQHWRMPGGIQLGQLIKDVIAIATRLPDWLCFYNGVGAGASIPHHLHFHAMPRPAVYPLLPLELAARRRGDNKRISSDYPLSFVSWRGDPSEVERLALAWTDRWLRGAGKDDEASANLIAGQSDDGLSLFFIPRHQRRSRAEGLAGVIGGFEALGEIVCSTEQELAWLESGTVDYHSIAKLLNQVSVEL